MWLYEVVRPGSMIKGPFPNPECPRVPNDTRRAVLPEHNLFLLGCLAQGTAFRGWIRGRRSLLPPVMLFKWHLLGIKVKDTKFFHLNLLES